MLGIELILQGVLKWTPGVLLFEGKRISGFHIFGIKKTYYPWNLTPGGQNTFSADT